MAISLRQAPAKYRGNINGGSVAFGSDNAAGSLITAIVTWGLSTAAATPSDTRGNTYHVAWDKNEVFGSIRTTCYYAYNCAAGANTVTFAGSNNTGDIDVAEWAGVLATADPLDATGTTASGSSTTPATGTITPSVANCLLVAGFVAAGGTSIVDPPSGFTSLMTEATAPIAAEDYEIQSGLTARNPSWSYTTSNRWAAGVAAFKAEPPPDPGPRPSPPPQRQGVRGFRPTRTGDYSTPLAAPTTPLPDRGMRVDVYEIGGLTKVGGGPLTTVMQTWYRQYLDEIGAGRVVLSASDPQKSLLTGRRELWFYKGGEGIVFRGIILSRRAKPYGQMEVELASVEEWLNTGAKTGLGRIFSAVSSSSFFTSILANTGWASGSIASATTTLTRRFDAKSVWEAILAAAKTFGGHVRADAVTLSGASPVKNVDLLIGTGSDNGLIFKNVTQVTPALAENTSVIPIAEFEEQGDATQIVTRVYPLGVGEGYPMMTLVAASRGANLVSNPDFEDGTVTGWTGTNATNGNITPAVTKNGTKMQQVSRSAGTSFSVAYPVTISGATAGRVYTFGIWVGSSSTSAGKTWTISLSETGGASGTATSTDTDVIATVLSADEDFVYMEVSRTLTANDRTGLSLSIGIASGAGAGDIFYVDRVTCWLSTTAAYCVEYETGAGGVAEYFIEDVAATAIFGLVPAYISVKDLTPTVATKAAWVAACDGMYDVGSRVLAQRTAEVMRYPLKPVNVRHVANGVQLIKPGQTSRLVVKAPVIDPFETAARNSFEIDTTVTILGFERTTTDVADEWQVDAAVGTLRAMDDAARLAELYQLYSGAENEVKQSNFVYAIDVTLTIPAASGSRFLEIPIADVLAIHKATVTIQQVKGTAVATGGMALYTAEGTTTIVTDGTGNWTDSVEYDITTAMVQEPTPVPWGAATVSTFLGDYVAVLLRVTAGSDGAAQEVAFAVTVQVEASKITAAPA